MRFARKYHNKVSEYDQEIPQWSKWVWQGNAKNIERDQDETPRWQTTDPTEGIVNRLNTNNQITATYNLK